LSVFESIWFPVALADRDGFQSADFDIKLCSAPFHSKDIPRQRGFHFGSEDA